MSQSPYIISYKLKFINYNYNYNGNYFTILFVLGYAKIVDKHQLLSTTKHKTLLPRGVVYTL